MKITTFTLVFLMASVSVLLPLVNPDYELDIIPNTPTSIILDVSNPTIILTSNTEALVEMNVSFINLTDNTTRLISTTQFIDSFRLDFNKNGFYLFEFFSLSLDTINFNFNGIFLLNIIIFTFAIIINLGYGVYYYYKEYLR